MRFLNPDLWSLRQKLRWFVILPPSLAVLLLTALVVNIVSKNEVEQQADKLARARIEGLAHPGGQLFRSCRSARPNRCRAAKRRGT